VAGSAVGATERLREIAIQQYRQSLIHQPEMSRSPCSEPHLLQGTDPTQLQHLAKTTQITTENLTRTLEPPLLVRSAVSSVLFASARA